MLEVVFHAVGGKFTLDAVAGAAHAGALGAAALDHEAGDAAVEDQSVIEAAVGQRNKVAHALRSDLRVELALHHAAVFQSNGKGGIRHTLRLLSVAARLCLFEEFFSHDGQEKSS